MRKRWKHTITTRQNKDNDVNCHGFQFVVFLVAVIVIVLIAVEVNAVVSVPILGIVVIPALFLLLLLLALFL